MFNFQTSDGLKIAYDVDDLTDPWKTSDTLVMLHSAMASAARYYAMVPPLSRHFRVVRMDMRGHGPVVLAGSTPEATTPLSLPWAVSRTLSISPVARECVVELVGHPHADRRAFCCFA